MFTGDWAATFLYSILRFSTPIIFAALAAAVCKKTGLLNMAIESMMLCSALAAVVFSGFSQSWLVGLLAAVLMGAVVGLVISYASFVGSADLYLTNIALNLAAAGGTVFVLFLFSGTKANSAAVIKSMKLPLVDIPIVRDIPFAGKVLSGHGVLTYLAFAAALAVWGLIYKTRLGLRMRAVCENPGAASSVGISAKKICFAAFTISGAIAGMGGAFMSMGYVQLFARDMVAGRGYIGLAASNMADGSPAGALLSSLLFGASNAAANTIQTAFSGVPSDFVLMIPYAVTIVAIVAISVIRDAQAKSKIKARG
ncbi:MAG: ABC transporter permease [Clostridiales bacterium]|nr:ABC transporter permease [Clostridiales bacterium]